MHRRCYRRIIECRGGLVRLSPYLPTTANISMNNSMNNSEDLAVLADQVRRGLRAHATATSTPTARAVPVAIPITDDLDADAHALTTLADALRHSDHDRPTLV